MAEESFRHLNEDKNELVDTWVSWLIEAGIDFAKGPEGFQTQVKKWLATLKGDSKQFHRSRSQIIALAGDLSSVTSLKSHIRISRSLRGAKRSTESSNARARGESGWRRWAPIRSCRRLLHA